MAKDLIFTQKSMGKIKPPATGYDIYKYKTSTYFCLKVTSKGTKTYMVRFKDGSKKAIKKESEISFSKAKSLADTMREASSKGVTLDEYNDSLPKDIPTFSIMASKYLQWAVNHKKETSIRADRERLQNHILPVLNNKPVDIITNRDLSSLFNNLIDKKHKYKYLKKINGISIRNLAMEDISKIFKELNISYEIESIDELDKIKSALKSFLEYQVGGELVNQYFTKNAEYYYITKTTTQGTVNKCRALISHMYNTAMTWEEKEWSCVKTNPCSTIKATRSKSKNRYLDKQELGRLTSLLNTEKYTNNNIAHLIRFLLLTGARRSEATNALWSHIDFNNKVWRKPENDSKTKLTPSVPLSDSAISLLRDMQKKSSSGYIFKSSVNPIKPVGEFRKSFNTIMKNANIEECTPHDLRRTFGSQLLLAGVDIYTVSKLLGHNSVSTTERHYAFLNRETLHNAVNALDKVIG